MRKSDGEHNLRPVHLYDEHLSFPNVHLRCCEEILATVSVPVTLNRSNARSKAALQPLAGHTWTCVCVNMSECVCVCACPAKEGLITGHFSSLMGTLHLCSLYSQEQGRKLICPALVTKRNCCSGGLSNMANQRLCFWASTCARHTLVCCGGEGRVPGVPGVTIHFLREFTAVFPTAGVSSLQVSETTAWRTQCQWDLFSSEVTKSLGG